MVGDDDQVRSVRRSMFQGDIVSIYVAAKAGMPTESRQQVEAIAGRGLEGDRYFDGTVHCLAVLG